MTRTARTVTAAVAGLFGSAAAFAWWMSHTWAQIWAEIEQRRLEYTDDNELL